MALLPTLAYGFAATFRMRDVARCFAGARIRQSKTQIVAEYGPERLAVGFDFGAVVFIDVPGEERARVVDRILREVAPEEPHPPLEEDYLIETRADAPPHGEVHFDRVVVRELGAPVVDLIALLLAQSVSLDYYEEDLQGIVTALDRITTRLARTGRATGSVRDLTRFVGSSVDTTNQIMSALALLDKPAATWEDEALDRLYRDLRTLLEIDDRYRALSVKLRTIQETLELLIDLSQTRRMLFLEATIVVLILAEIAMSLVDRL